MSAELNEINFDPDELAKKYRLERDKRLRQDGNEQYQEVSGEFSYFVEDPYLEEEIEREPLTDEVEVLIIGGGFGGMLAAARLREAGIDDFRIIEKGGNFGGTWYWNRYPGASCDIEAYIYFPLLEETGFVPKEKYTNASETLDYCHLICKKYKLYDNACLQTEVTSTVWDENAGLWTVKTDREDSIKARYVVHSNGPLNRPKLPAMKGINDFKGHTFHTSRWDYDYTGGDTKGNLTNLKDKRVAVIGTGATAIQCVPHLGASAETLFVFQRTPSSVDVRNNRPTDPDWISTQESGWHNERRNNFETLLTGGRVKEDLVSDGWTEAFRLLFGSLRDKAPSKLKMFSWAATSVFSPGLYKNGFKQYMTDKATDYMDLANAMQMADFQKMEKVRARAEETVKDQKTAESLKPYYNQFCKRPCFHDEYLPTYNRENVHLIDTDGKGLEEMSEKGIIFNGIEYEVDCIIFATGFEVGTDYSRRCGYQIEGINGLTVSEKWKDGLETFHGMHSRGFPNCFFFGPAQSGFTATYTYSLDEQSIHLAYILEEAKQRGAIRIEASKEAEDGWIETIIEKARLTATFQENCTPGYYNNEGKVNQTPQNNTYGGGPIEFFSLMKKWRSKGKLEGLELN
ncbi:MAG TPA: NAD(P)/FAD-dependent oxidoreductase [SAR86 cluster bacterium]|nr:NAD(P)/FAD-dependent oxidoreductase [SAR86 cluster bacterium]|tara:strand:- start:2368 stop:4251 length:1884 start_codon:yes stop_codon:yes gene_type:complete